MGTSTKVIPFRVPARRDHLIPPVIPRAPLLRPLLTAEDVGAIRERLRAGGIETVEPEFDPRGAA